MRRDTRKFSGPLSPNASWAKARSAGLCLIPSDIDAQSRGPWTNGPIVEDSMSRDTKEICLRTTARFQQIPQRTMHVDPLLLLLKGSSLRTVVKIVILITACTQAISKSPTMCTTHLLHRPYIKRFAFLIFSRPSFGITYLGQCSEQPSVPLRLSRQFLPTATRPHLPQRPPVAPPTIIGPTRRQMHARLEGSTAHERQ
jgi:hypothetical protein